MEIKDINPAVLNAVVGMLKPYSPELNSKILVKAIQAFETCVTSPSIEKPMTRAQVAVILGVSLNSVNRYLNSGKLRRIKLTERSCRVDSQSVRALLQQQNTEA